MAYVSKEDKAKLTPGIKAVLKKYGMKGSISVRNHSGLVVKITSGPLDIMGDYKRACIQDTRNDLYDPSDVARINSRLQATYIDVNSYYMNETYTGTIKAFMQELHSAMEGEDFFNHDDGMTDYFHRSHYTYILVGTWDKPYTCTGVSATFAPVELIVHEHA